MIRILFLYKDHEQPDGVDIEGLRNSILLSHGNSTHERMDSIGGSESVEIVDPVEEVEWYGEREHCKEPDATNAVAVQFGTDERTDIISKQLMRLSTIMASELGRPLNYIILDY